jgi:transposase
MAESKPKKKLGRPEKLTPETQTEIVNALATGVYIETAAATAGISKNTLYDWIRKGTRLKAKEQLTEGEEKYVAFSDAVKKAMADSEMRDVALIARAAQTNWTAAAWHLERKYPKRWARREFREIDMQGAVTSAKIDLSDREEQELEVAIAKFFGVAEDISIDEDVEHDFDLDEFEQG